MRPAVSHRYPKALAVAHDNIGSKLTRWAEEGQGQQVGCNHDQSVCAMGLLAKQFIIQNSSVGGWILQEHPKSGLAEVVLAIVSHNHGIAKRLRPGLNHLNGLRVAQVGDKENVSLGVSTLGAFAEGHRLGCGCTLIQKRSISNLQAGQVSNHRLEVEQGF